MSEAELHLIRSRLTLGLQHKAAKGELKIPLPVGLDYDEDGQVAVSADEAVREAIGCIFRRFTELGSARQVMLSLLDDGVLLPRRPAGVSGGKITWLKASYQAVQHTLRNPAYAGAFVFGQTRTEKHLDAGGRLITRTRALPMHEWAVLIRDHHPGYITWDQYEANLKVLAGNRRPAAGQGGGALREGPALLQGLIRCGKCSRVMRTRYSGGTPGRPGSCPRHECVKAKLHFGTERICQSIGGRKVEKLVLDQLFQVLEPASLAATAKAMTEAEQHWQANLAVFETAVERARFDADRAMRQYDAVEPENRLVARTLERALEDKLTTLRRAEHDLAAQKARRPVALTPDELDWITRAGADVKAVFHAPTTTLRERKQLIRAVISEIVLTVEDTRRIAEVTIIWQGGATSTGTIQMNRPGAGHDHTLPGDTAELIGRLAQHYDDSTIAHILAQQRRTTGTGLRWTKTRVASQRFRLGIPAYQPRSPQCQCRRPGCDRGHHHRSRENPRHPPDNALPVATRRIHHRRADRPRSALAHPHRPGTTRQDPITGPRRLAARRPGRQGPRAIPHHRVSEGPRRSAARHPRQQRTAPKPSHPGETRSSRTLRHTKMKGEGSVQRSRSARWRSPCSRCDAPACPVRPSSGQPCQRCRAMWSRRSAPPTRRRSRPGSR